MSGQTVRRGGRASLLASALGRITATEQYADKNDSDCGGLSQPDKLVHTLKKTPLVVAFVSACDVWRTPRSKKRNVQVLSYENEIKRHVQWLASVKIVEWLVRLFQPHIHPILVEKN